MLFLAALILLSTLGNAQSDNKIVVKFHSEGNNKEMKIELLKFFPSATQFFNKKTQNVSISIIDGVATLTPAYNWKGDEVLVFSPNRTVIEELEKSAIEQQVTTNLEPIIELNFPSETDFVASAGRMDFSIVAYDPDDNPLVAEWLVNGIAIKRDTSKGGIVSHFTFNQEDSEEGHVLKGYKFDKGTNYYSVSAVVNDSRASRRIEWRFNIANQTCIDKWQCLNWTECTDSRRTRVCTKVNRECPANLNKPPTVWLDPFCFSSAKLECRSNWTCDDWSECKTDYKADILVKGVIAETIGTRQERKCYDSSFCVGSVGIETKDCDRTIPVTTREVEWCHSRYIEVYNSENGMLLSRVRRSLVGEGGMDIDLSMRELSRMSYCWYCFDAIKDFDEEAIDCGGASCPVCGKKEMAGYNVFDSARFILFIVADILLLFYLWRMSRGR